MTYGYGDEPNGWRPPTRPEPPAGPRHGRADEYPEASEYERGRYVVPPAPDEYRPRQYQPPGYEPPAYGTEPDYYASGYRSGYPQHGYPEQDTYRAPPRPAPPRGYEPDPYPSWGSGSSPTGGYPQQPAQPYRGGHDTYRGHDDRPAVPRTRVDPPRASARPAAPTPARRRRSGIAALVLIMIVLAAGGTTAVLVMKGGGGSTGSPTVAATPVGTKEIADQKADPEPLTEAEVFGVTKIASTAPGAALYHVVKSQQATGCGTAVTGTISTLLTSLGCTQVVRATILSPDGAYVITAGVFNMPDARSATRAHDSIKAAVDARKGRFNGFAAGGNTDVIAQAATHLAWDTRGHYLIYCVIALTNGKAITATDVRTPLIVTDVLEKYLSDDVIGAREVRLVSPSPSAS